MQKAPMPSRFQKKRHKLYVFDHENETLCPVAPGNMKTSSVDHIVFQNVKLQGWSTINKSLLGYHLHDLPRVLMNTDLVKSLLTAKNVWQPI
eukprot:10899782-Karenia_brevis.AAC.1